MLARAVGWLIHRQVAVTSKNKHRITLFILGYRVADEVGNGSRDPHSVVAKGPKVSFCWLQDQRILPQAQAVAKAGQRREKTAQQKGAIRVLIDG